MLNDNFLQLVCYHQNITEVHVHSFGKYDETPSNIPASSQISYRSNATQREEATAGKPIATKRIYSSGVSEKNTNKFVLQQESNVPTERSQNQTFSLSLQRPLRRFRLTSEASACPVVPRHGSIAPWGCWRSRCL